MSTPWYVQWNNICQWKKHKQNQIFIVSIALIDTEKANIWEYDHFIYIEENGI